MRLVVGLGCALAGCQAASAPAVPVSSEPEPTPIAPEVPSQAEPAPSEPEPEPPEQSAEPESAPERLEPEQWLAAHEVPGPAAEAFVKGLIRVEPGEDYACQSAPVGADELLDCRVFRLVDQGDMTRVTFQRVLVSVAGAKPSVALKLTTTIEVMDKEDVGQPPLLELSLTYIGDGSTLVVSDATPDTGCDRAISGAKEVERSASKAWGRFDLKLMRSACAARGVYRFKAGRFVRGPGPTRIAPGTSGP